MLTVFISKLQTASCIFEGATYISMLIVISTFLISMSRNITDGFINEIIQELNNKRIYDTAKNNEKMHIVLQYMRSKGFQIKKFE